MQPAQPCLIGMEACSGAHHWARLFRQHGHTVRLMSEFGIVLPQKVTCLRREIGAHLEDLPGYANRCIGDLLAHADQLDARIDDYDRIIAQAAREDARSSRLMERPGIGPLSASALLASQAGRLLARP